MHLFYIKRRRKRAGSDSFSRISRVDAVGGSFLLSFAFATVSNRIRTDLLILAVEIEEVELFEFFEDTRIEIKNRT